MIENCYYCKYLEKKRNAYSCSFKKCNMGPVPYYTERIPRNAKMNYGFIVCDFQPVTEDEMLFRETLQAYCYFCYSHIYSLYAKDIRFLWTDALTRGYPICNECSVLVEHLEQFEYGKKQAEKRESKRKLQACQDCDTQLCDNDYSKCIKRWDCKICKCTYDISIEKKPKNGICHMCRNTVKEKKNQMRLNKWLEA